MAKTFSLRGLLFIVALSLICFIGGLVNAVKVKAQDPAPAYQTAVQFANTEVSLTLKAVNEKIQDAYSVKQENKNFSNSENIVNSECRIQNAEFKNISCKTEILYLNQSTEQKRKNLKSEILYLKSKKFPIIKQDAQRFKGFGIHTAKVIRD